MKDMEKRNFHLRIAKPEDAEEILKIYAPYVEKTAITFEYEVPSVEEFRGRIENTLQHYPYLVAEDETGILGYAYDWAVFRHGRPTTGPWRLQFTSGWIRSVWAWAGSSMMHWRRA